MPRHALTPQAAFWLSLLSLVFCATLASMVAAWGWAIGRIRSGRPLLPEPKPRAVPWGIGSVLLVFFAFLAVNFGVAYVYMKLSGVHDPRKLTPVDQMALVSLSNLVLLAVIPALLRLTSGATLADLGIERRGLGAQALAGTVGFLLFAPLVYILNGLALLLWKQNKHPLEQMVVTEPTAGIACLAFLSAVVLAPAAEELIFRGVIQNWLQRFFLRPDVEEALDLAADLNPDPDAGAGPGVGGRAVSLPPLDTAVEAEVEVASSGEVTRLPVELSVDPAAILPGWEPSAGLVEPERIAPSSRRRQPWHAPILITSAVFAAVHMPQWPAPLAIFFLSVGLGAVYQRTGSLIASFVMHALFNGLGTMMLFMAILAGHPADPKVAPTATYSENERILPGAHSPPVLRERLKRP
jgi:membrane protease YdiL (CAAX protease family)